MNCLSKYLINFVLFVIKRSIISSKIILFNLRIDSQNCKYVKDQMVMKLQLGGKPEVKCIYFEPVKTKQTIGLVFGCPQK
jgi:hypothetical protein